MIPRKSLTFLQAALVVLRQQGEPLTPKQIMHLALTWRLVESDGLTPHTAMRARLYTDIKRHERKSPFRVVGPGRFGLREWRRDITALTQTSAYLRAAVAVLEREQQPMTAKAMIKEALDLGLLEESASHNTMRARLSMNVAQNREASTFARTGANTFVLRQWIREGRFTEYKARPFAKELSRGQRVLAIPQGALDRAGRFQGVCRDWQPYADLLESTDLPTHIERFVAEGSDDWKQVLTYILVRLPDQRCVAFRRGSYSNIASFLAGQRCLGFGGHVDQDDRSLFSADWGIRSGAERELAEEMGTSATVDELEVVGVLNDDSSPVGLRHFAFVFEARLKTTPQRPKDLKGEWDVNELTFTSKDDIEADFHSFEYWSQLCAMEYLGAQPQGARVKRRTPNVQFNPRALYVVAGEIASGKTEVSRAIAETLNLHGLSTREVVESLVGEPLDEQRRLVFADLAGQLVSTDAGVAAYADELVRRVREMTQGGVVIDGVRHPAAIERLRKARRDVVVVYVETLPDMAFALYNLRNRHASLDDFRAMRQHSVERQLPLVAPEADLTIYNYGSLESLRSAVREALA